MCSMPTCEDGGTVFGLAGEGDGSPKTLNPGFKLAAGAVADYMVDG